MITCMWHHFMENRGTYLISYTSFKVSKWCHILTFSNLCQNYSRTNVIFHFNFQELNNVSCISQWSKYIFTLFFSFQMRIVSNHGSFVVFLFSFSVFKNLKQTCYFRVTKLKEKKNAILVIQTRKIIIEILSILS